GIRQHGPCLPPTRASGTSTRKPSGGGEARPPQDASMDGPGIGEAEIWRPRRSYPGVFRRHEGPAYGCRLSAAGSRPGAERPSRRSSNGHTAGQGPIKKFCGGPTCVRTASGSLICTLFSSEHLEVAPNIFCRLVHIYRSDPFVLTVQVRV